MSKRLRLVHSLGLVIGISDLFRHWKFVIRHSYLSAYTPRAESSNPSPPSEINSHIITPRGAVERERSASMEMSELSSILGDSSRPNRLARSRRTSGARLLRIMKFPPMSTDLVNRSTGM